MTDTAGWHFANEEPTFAGHEVMEQAEETMRQEAKEAIEKGEHYLLTIVGFRFMIPDVPHMPVVLDHTTMRVAPQTGCFICEEPYGPGMSRECPGEPPG